MTTNAVQTPASKLQTLQSFTQRDCEARAYLCQPWVDGDYAYACNGFWVARMPMCGDFAGLAQTTKEHPSYIESLFLKANFKGLAPMPEIAKPAKCADCGGTGTVSSIRCPDCDGYGDFRHGEHYYECKECDGDGRTKQKTTDLGAEAHACDECGGLGYGSTFKIVPFGNTHARDAYLWHISQLPGVQFATNPDPAKAIAFRFDGGEVLLMPCRA